MDLSLSETLPTRWKRVIPLATDTLMASPFLSDPLVLQSSRCRKTGRNEASESFITRDTKQLTREHSRRRYSRQPSLLDLRPSRALRR